MTKKNNLESNLLFIRHSIGCLYTVSLKWIKFTEIFTFYWENSFSSLQTPFGQSRLGCTDFDKIFPSLHVGGGGGVDVADHAGRCLIPQWGWIFCKEVKGKNGFYFRSIIIAFYCKIFTTFLRKGARPATPSSNSWLPSVIASKLSKLLNLATTLHLKWEYQTVPW